jgi:hypothetical protein
MISEYTHKSQWVTWELEESLENGNSIICMALKGLRGSFVLPEPARRLKLPLWEWDYEWLDKLVDDPRLNVVRTNA